MSNETFREHVTSVGFSLSLTKRQIQTLVLAHHFKTFDKMFAFTYQRSVFTHYVSTSRSLQRRGLYTHENSLTTAGSLVVQLFQEAGIYAEVLGDLGIDLKASA